MQSAMRDYTEEVRRKGGLELRIRVGLNSGEVVVRTIGNDLHTQNRHPNGGKRVKSTPKETNAT